MSQAISRAPTAAISPVAPSFFQQLNFFLLSFSVILILQKCVLFFFTRCHTRLGLVSSFFFEAPPGYQSPCPQQMSLSSLAVSRNDVAERLPSCKKWNHWKRQFSRFPMKGMLFPHSRSWLLLDFLRPTPTMTEARQIWIACWEKSRETVALMRRSDLLQHPSHRATQCLFS